MQCIAQFRQRRLAIVTALIPCLLAHHDARAFETSVSGLNVSAEFPCKVESKKMSQETGAGPVHANIFTCQKGSTVYTLGITAYPDAIVESLTPDEFLDSTLDDARSKPYMKIVSNTSTTHQSFKAMDQKVMDNRAPQTETRTRAVWAHRNLIIYMILGPPNSLTASDLAAKYKKLVIVPAQK